MTKGILYRINDGKEFPIGGGDRKVKSKYGLNGLLLRKTIYVCVFSPSESQTIPRDLIQYLLFRDGWFIIKYGLKLVPKKRPFHPHVWGANFCITLPKSYSINNSIYIGDIIFISNPF